MRAILDRVIVKRRPADSMAGRFHVVTNEKTDTGTVVAVGPGRIHPETGERIPIGIYPNELVYFDRLAGQELEENGERYLVLTPEAIIGVAEPESAAAKQLQDAVAALKWPEERAAPIDFDRAAAVIGMTA